MSWEYFRVLCRYGSTERYTKYESTENCYFCLHNHMNHKSSYIGESASTRLSFHICKWCFEKRRVKLGKSSKLNFIRDINYYRFSTNLGNFIWNRDYIE